MEFQIRQLQKKDNRQEFNCGQEDLDYFFKRFAGQNQFRYHIGVNYIATNDETIFGFITLAMGSLEVQGSIAKNRLPEHYPLPILRIGRLAVDIRFQGQGIGKQLLRHALLLALQQRDVVGCAGVVVDAKPDAVEFYENLGYKIIKDVQDGEMRTKPSPVLMFVSIKSIR